MTRRIPASALAFLIAVSTVCAAGEGAGVSTAPVQIGRAGLAFPDLDMRGAPQATVSYQSIPLLAGLPMQSQFYAINPNVVASGYFYHFGVRSVDGTANQVGGIGKLVKLCHEIEVIEQIRGINKGKEFAQGVGEGLKNIGTGVGNLVMHPGISLKNFGKRAQVFGRSVERTTDDIFGDGAEASAGTEQGGRSQLGDGPAGQQRRTLAYDMGVDVYTDNPVLRRELTDLSHVKAAGGFATWVVPYHLSLLGGFNALTGDAQTELLIRDQDPAELRRTVGKDLEPLFGQARQGGETPLARFLYNPNFTPRQVAYAGRDFQLLSGVANLGYVLQCLARASTPEEADLLAAELRMYSALNARRQLKTFVPFDEGLFAALSRDDVFFYLFVGDTVRPWSVNAEGFVDLVKDAMGAKARAMEIWCVGDVEPQIVQQAAARNVTVRANVLLDKSLFPDQLQR